MHARSIFVAGALLITAAPAMAQAGPTASVSSDQLVCQLSGDCGGHDASLNTQDKPESRGFSIARHQQGAPANAAVKAPSPPMNAHQNRSLAATPARGAASAPVGRFAIAHHPVGPVGHADLSINFVSGSAELTDSGRSLAQTFMQALRSPQLAGKRFMIAGHTDAVGSRTLNLDLSKRRAQSLVEFLVSQGASRTQFDVKGFGFDRPLPGTVGTAPSNRRVEVVTLN